MTNAPGAGCYPHRVADGAPETPEAWLESSREREGSWWPDWDEWQSAHAGELVPARAPGGGGLKAITPAPGAYVRERATQAKD